MKVPILKYITFILLFILLNPSSVLSTDGSLWVGEKKKVIEVSIDDGEHLLEIPAMHLEDIAVDNYRGVIWVGTRKEIIQYSLAGEEIFRYPLNIEDDCKGDNCGERIVHISLDYSDGSLWIGAKDEVIKLANDAHEFFRIKDVGHVKDVSVDISDGSCWVGLKDKAIKYSSNGTVLLGFDIENGNKIQALATDPLNNSLWIGTKKGLIEVDKDGFEQFRIDEPFDIQDLRIDINDALVWVVTKKEVFKYSSDEGKRLLSLDPCSHDIKCEGNLITLAVDPYDSSCWIAWRKSLLKLSYIGEYLLWLNGFKQIEALDIGLPELRIKITEPLDGAVVDTPVINVKGEVTDPTAKVTVNGLEASVSGNNFEAQGIQLKEGINTITATATNLAHISVSDTIHVTYQPLIPPLSIQIDSPVEGAVFSTSTIDVMGTVSDPSASVDVNGAPASVIGNSFQVQGLQLNPGTNIITATAILSGISVWDSIIVTYQPLPPLTVEISSPVEGATFSTSRIDITGTVSDSKAKVTVNGIEAIVSGNTFTATAISLTLGENLITVIATDETGRTASDTVRVNYTWLNISITYPPDGDILDASPIDVEGVVSDPPAYVEVNGREAEVSTNGSFITYGVSLSEGQNQIMAQASNSIGQRDENTVQVTYQPPSPPLSVSILSPYDVSTIESDYFTVTGIVNDPEATVLVNDTLAHVEDNFYKTSIYACEPPVVPEAGPQQSWVCTVTVTAYSKDGQVATTSFAYTYSPSDDPLTVKITDPASNQIVTYSPYEVQGEFYDVLLAVSPATVKVNGIMAVVIDGNRFSAPVPLNDGLNYVTVRATNAVGHDAFDTIKIIYEPSDKPLGITIYSPLDQAIVNYSPISVFGGVSYSTAEVDVSGIFADFNKDSRSFKVTYVPLSPGENLITATVWIPTEETATVSITVIYDPNYPSPPTPTLSELPEYTQSSVTVSGLTFPSYKVEIFANGTSRAVVWADSNGLFKAAISLPDEGPNHISARAIDIYGNKSNLSNEEVVIRDTIRPTIRQVKNHIDTLDLTASRVLLTGITEPLAEVDISIDYDPEYKYHTTADERGRFYIITHISAGQHYVGIIAKDKAGNKGSFSAPMRVHNVSPTPWGGMLLGSTGRPIPPKIDPIPNPINETSLTVEGNAYSYSLVKVYRNNELVGTVPANNRGRFRLDGVTLMPGRNIIKVRQKETQLDMGTWCLFLNAADSPEVAVDVISGTPTRPHVEIDFPMNGSITDAEFLALRGTIDTPDAILRLNGYYNYNGYATTMNGNFISNQKIPLLPGENTLWIEATSSDGSRGVDKITVYSKKDSQVPSVNITSPLEGEEIYDRYTSISGTVGDSVQRVIVNESEAILGNGSFELLIDIFSSYVYNPYGYERMVTAWAMDGNGNIGHHDVPFRYRYIPTPSLSITSPLDGETLGLSPITVTGNIYNASEITVNGVPATIDKNMFTAQIDLLEGENTIIVIAKNTVKASVKTIYVTYILGSTITLQSITIEPSSGVLPLGDTLQLRAIGTYSNGDKVDLTQQSIWTSSNENIAAVSRGFVTTESTGTTTITATYGGITARTPLYVSLPTLKFIRVTYEKGGRYMTDNPNLIIGETLQFKALGGYTDGSLMDVSSKVTWGSSDATIAAIDAKGLATALSKGTTQISATYQSITGSSTLTVEPPPMYIFITSPVDDSIIDRGEITVTGTVITEAPEVGVTVNGIVANTIGNQFVANHVPLIEGSIITAIATDVNGNTATASITVIAVTPGNYIRLTSNIESGIPPLEVTLRIDGSFSITDSTLSVTGPAQPEVLYASIDEYKVKMTLEGIYYFTANVTGPDGNVYQDTIAITVLNPAQIDNLLRSKWEGMKVALAVGNINEAVINFDSASQGIYRDQFIALSPILPDIVNELNTALINMISVENRIAEYEILVTREGTTFSLHLKFVRSDNGLWKIWSY